MGVWRTILLTMSVVVLGAQFTGERVTTSSDAAPLPSPVTPSAIRIVEPIVNRRISEYRSVRFSPGEIVTINAGGCAHSGGEWYSYVNPYLTNPRDRDAARIRHGLIWIPGATPGLVRISNVIARPLIVPTTID